MNSNTEKAEDRFGDTTPKKNIELRSFVPELIYREKLSQTGYANFTIDKEYPVIGRDLFSLKFKTVDDKGVEVWIADDYFVPAKINLCGDKELNFTGKATNLTWEKDSSFAESDKSILKCCPNIRKVKLNPLSENEAKIIKTRNVSWVWVMEPSHEAGYITAEVKNAEVINAITKDTHKLAGVTPKHNPWANEKLDQPEKIVLTSESSKEEQQAKKEKLEKVLTAKLCSGGEAKENDLLYNHEQLWENMGKVFTEYRKLDSDVVTETVQKSFPNRNIYWKDSYLQVDGAKTKIHKADVDSMFNGLKKLTSPKTADRMVAKLIVKKLKKLF